MDRRIGAAFRGQNWRRRTKQRAIPARSNPWLNFASAKPLIWPHGSPHSDQKVTPCTGSPQTYRPLDYEGQEMQSRLKEGFEVNRTVYFNSPFLLGFEHLERLLER